MHQERTVVVTGAGGGIDEKIVDRFLANGDTVVGLDRSEKKRGGLYPKDLYFSRHGST